MIEPHSGVAAVEFIKSYISGDISLYQFQIGLVKHEHSLFGTPEAYHYNSRTPEGQMVMTTSLLLDDMLKSKDQTDGEFLNGLRKLIG